GGGTNRYAGADTGSGSGARRRCRPVRRAQASTSAQKTRHMTVVGSTSSTTPALSPVESTRPTVSNTISMTLLAMCSPIAASRPPVRMVITAATTPNRKTETRPQTLYTWPAANSRLVRTTGTAVQRVHEPTSCRRPPRKTYSSAAAWNGTTSTTTTSAVTRVPSRASGRTSSPATAATATLRTRLAATTANASAVHRPSQPQRTRPSTEWR